MILKTISRQVGVSVADLEVICYTANRRYKNYKIEKRTGGVRHISHPTPELKFLQRWLNTNLFSELPVHECAYAYRKGRNIVDNAKLHVQNKYLLKIDFFNFFPSLRDCDIEALLLENRHLIANFEREDIDVVNAIVCKEGRLTIGAPSSPPLSNALLYAFDKKMAQRAVEEGVVYSRYADDLFFSTQRPDVLSGILEEIRKDLKVRISPRLKINNQKTVFTSAKHRRVVTGLILSSKKKISIGRKNKRRVKSLIYWYSQGKLSSEEMSYLRGYLAYINDVERDFVSSIRAKFGNKLIVEIMENEPVARKQYRDT